MIIDCDFSPPLPHVYAHIIFLMLIMAHDDITSGKRQAASIFHADSRAFFRHFLFAPFEQQDAPAAYDISHAYLRQPFSSRLLPVG